MATTSTQSPPTLNTLIIGSPSSEPDSKPLHFTTTIYNIQCLVEHVRSLAIFHGRINEWIINQSMESPRRRRRRWTEGARSRKPPVWFCYSRRQRPLGKLRSRREPNLLTHSITFFSPSFLNMKAGPWPSRSRAFAQRASLLQAAIEKATCTYVRIAREFLNACLGSRIWASQIKF